ncbi:hypothetical protein [Streptomyces goshikiensis]
MCIRVQLTSADPLIPYDPRRRLISVPALLPPESVLIVVRAILAELAVPQPSAGARCYCGEPVMLPRVSSHQSEGVVMRRGA